MTDPHQNRIQDVPDVLSVEPQENGEIRFEVYAGVEVGFKQQRKPESFSDLTEGRNRYQVAVYKGENRIRELTDDFHEATELFGEAMNNPESFRENHGN